MAILTGAIRYRGSFKSIRTYVNLHDGKTTLVPQGAIHFRILNHISTISDYEYSEQTRTYEATSGFNAQSAFLPEKDRADPNGSALFCYMGALSGLVIQQLLTWLDFGVGLRYSLLKRLYGRLIVAMGWPKQVD